MVCGMTTMWGCRECGGVYDALEAWIEPDRIRLYHARDGAKVAGPLNRCGPLEGPNDAEQRAEMEEKQRRRELRGGLPNRRRKARGGKVEVVRDGHDCQVCGGEIRRSRYASGRWETRSKWLFRKYCRVECVAKARRKKGVRRVADRVCPVCDGRMERRESASGLLEAWTEYNRRETCSKSCGSKWSWMKGDRRRVVAKAKRRKAKRVDLTDPKCLGCGEGIERSVYVGGKVESLACWQKRKYHGRECQAMVQSRRAAMADGRVCGYCSKALERKRYAGGRLEKVADYRKRKTCGGSCAMKLAYEKRERTPWRGKGDRK